MMPVWGGEGSEGVLEGRVMEEVSEAKKDAHVIGEGSGGFEGKGVKIPLEPDTPSRKSYISSSESGESVDSDRDERHDYVEFEETESLHSSESDISTEEEEEEEEELRGRRYVQARLRRSGRRVVGGRRRIRRRGLGGASSSRSCIHLSKLARREMMTGG